MGASHLSFFNKQVAIAKLFGRGLFAPNQWSGTAPRMPDMATFSVCTGSSDVPDITFNQSSAVTLIPDSDMVFATPMRCYVTRFDLYVMGSTPWTAADNKLRSIALMDTAGGVFAMVPQCALKAAVGYTFPDSDAPAPLFVGNGKAITMSAYNAATPSITFSAAVCNAASDFIGVPLTIIEGTGKGQTQFIVANASTTALTLANAFPIAPDATSVFEIPYYAASSGSVSTAVLIGGAFTVNALDNGFSMVQVNGAGIGGNRAIQSNTATTPTTVTAYNTAPAASTLVQLTTESNLSGALDCGIGEKWACGTLNKGLVVALQTSNGAFTGGPPVRCYVEGYFAP